MQHIRLHKPGALFRRFGLGVLILLLSAGAFPLHAQQYESDAAIAKLKEEAKPLVETTAPAFIKEYKALNITLTALQTAMFYPAKISKLCLVLSKTSWALQKGFEGASNLPYVGKPAEAVAKSLGGMKEGFDRWKKKMDDVSKECGHETIRARALNAFLTSMTLPSTLALGLEKGLPGYIDATQKLIDTKKKAGMKAGDVMDRKLASDIRDDARNVKGLNAAYSVLLPPGREANTSMQTELLPPFEAIMDFHDNLQPYDEKLSPLEHSLRQINDVLGKKFSHGFKYPHPSWSHPFRTRTYHVRISVRDILKGTGHVEHIIKHDLSHFLYKALKVFGFDKFVKEFLRDGEREAKREFEHIAIKAVDQIPGASKIMSEADDVENSIDDLDHLSSIDFRDANRFAQLLTDAMKAAH